MAQKILLNKKILIPIIIFSSFFVIYIVTMFSINLLTKEINTQNTTESVVSKTDNPYFTPSMQDKEISLKGEIQYYEDPLKSQQIRHFLVNNEGKKIVYLKSSNLDLNMNIGFNAEVVGEMTNEIYDGIKVFNVKYLKFK